MHVTCWRTSPITDARGVRSGSIVLSVCIPFISSSSEWQSTSCTHATSYWPDRTMRPVAKTGPLHLLTSSPSSPTGSVVEQSFQTTHLRNSRAWKCQNTQRDTEADNSLTHNHRPYTVYLAFSLCWWTVTGGQTNGALTWSPEQATKHIHVTRVIHVIHAAAANQTTTDVTHKCPNCVLARQLWYWRAWDVILCWIHAYSLYNI